MVDSTNTLPRNGATNRTSAGTHSGEQPLANDTLNRTNERTCTSEAHHSNIGKARLFQRKHAVAEVCTVHKIDKESRLIDNDKQQKNTVITATLP